jgi:hypothetical protein
MDMMATFSSFDQDTIDMGILLIEYVSYLIIACDLLVPPDFAKHNNVMFESQGKSGFF